MKARILVIDDEAEIRRSVRMILEYEGYDVRHLVINQVYDVAPKLADLLMLGGYASPDASTVDAADDWRRKDSQR